MPKLGWLCSYTPIELIDAAGAAPVGIKSDSGAEHEDVLLGDSICSFARSCMGGALTGVYDDLSGVVIAHSCECMRKLADGWAFRQNDIHPELIHILDVPKVVSESSIRFFANQLQRFRTVLEQRFGEISADALRRSIAKYDRTRELFGAIEAMRKAEATPVTGREMEELVSAFLQTPAEQLHPRLEAFIAAKEDQSGEKDLPRVMVIGGPGNASLIPTLENAGGISVVEHMCTGLRSYTAPGGNDEEPLMELSRRYLSKPACPRMLGSKAKETVAGIRELAAEYSVDGILYYSMKFCANMQMQWAHLKNDIDLDLPMKGIEGDISSEINEREIHSFIKRLRKRRKPKK